MTNKRLLPLIAAAALLFGGCAGERFTAYVGQPPNWPTAPGAFVQERHGVRVYRGYPERPYAITGRIELRRGALADLEFAAAVQARRHGADAAIIVNSARGRRKSQVELSYEEFLAGKATFPKELAGPLPLQQQTATVYLILFKN
ncbi:MAG TPA: hypothetical protein VI454_06240 [Verrucomicrobiae bacterium]|jgi:hypothetical protein